MKEYKYTINGNPYAVEINSVEKTYAKLTVNGVKYTVEFAQPEDEEEKNLSAHEKHVKRVAEKKQEIEKAQKQRVISSPLPGVILSISAAVGDQVRRGQKVAVLEAMKMENDIEADRDGKVTAVYVQKGDSVLEGAPIIAIE